MIKVFTKQAFEFKDDEGKPVIAKYNDFSELPDWVEKTPTYQLGVKAGLIVPYQGKTTPTASNSNSKAGSKTSTDSKK